MGDSLIGKTVDSGSIVPGSSPGLPANQKLTRTFRLYYDQPLCWSFWFQTNHSFLGCNNTTTYLIAYLKALFYVGISKIHLN